jgi:hypothetical protein
VGTVTFHGLGDGRGVDRLEDGDGSVASETETASVSLSVSATVDVTVEGSKEESKSDAGDLCTDGRVVLLPSKQHD